jgi:hypothetical protein
MRDQLSVSEFFFCHGSHVVFISPMSPKQQDVSGRGQPGTIILLHERTWEANAPPLPVRQQKETCTPRKKEAAPKHRKDQIQQTGSKSTARATRTKRRAPAVRPRRMSLLHRPAPPPLSHQPAAAGRQPPLTYPAGGGNFGSFLLGRRRCRRRRHRTCT